MKAEVFVEKAIDIAKNYKTLYVMGCFGAPLHSANKARYTQNHTYNMQPSRTEMINAASSSTFGFDCVNLIKGILWGWDGDVTKTYGGAVYKANGVADESANIFFKNRCKPSTDWSNIQVGEALWCEGHIGIYIGDGLGVECTPAFANNVQITNVGNIGTKSGYPTRKWTKHGKISYIDYSGVTVEQKPSTETKPTSQKYKLNDLVEFTGSTQYTSSSSQGKAVKAKPCKARITGINLGSAHPYHCITVSGLGVYGWVNEADIKLVETVKTIKKGSKVKVLNPVTYTGKTFKVYYSEYDVIQVSGNRVVIGKNNVVTAAVHKDNLQVI